MSHPRIYCPNPLKYSIKNWKCPNTDPSRCCENSDGLKFESFTWLVCL